MDQSTIPQPAGRSSAIPRLSRLPVPKSFASNSLKPKPSTETLRTRPPVTSSATTQRSSSTQSFKVPYRPSSSQHTRPHASSAKPVVTTNRKITRTAPTSSAPSVRPSSKVSNDTASELQPFRSVSSASSRVETLVGEEEPPNPGTNASESRKPRLSLAERTIESIAKVPASPANGRRRSSFFQQQSPITTSRPPSAIGARSRTGSQEDMPIKPLVLPGKLVVRGVQGAKATGTQSTSNRSFSASVRPKPAATPPKGPSPTKQARRPIGSSKTVAARPAKTTRPALAGLFNPPNTQGEEDTPKKSTLGVRRPVEISKSPKAEIAANSSQSLREQIRAARAAKRSLGAKPDVSAAASKNQGSSFDFEFNDDPFNQQPKDGSSALRLKVDAARSEGRLNISCMGLKEIPEEVLKIYDYEFNKQSGIAWNETVDLVKFIAADNEIESIPENVFPDMESNAFSPADEEQNPQFGGIELLDFHGNLLFDVPAGLRRLERLTSLNLSRNRLMNDSLDTIAQVSSLRELRIAENALTGELSSCISSLTQLEVLEIQGNKLCNLPEEISALIHLRVLNVSNNQLTSLPTAALSKMPLVSLIATKNHITGTLFIDPNYAMNRLQILDISVNWLTSFSSGSVALPMLRELNIAFNKMTELPSMSTWTSLITLYAEDNKLSSLPEGFTDISTLRNVDFTGNDFPRLDARIGTMDKLETFKVAANPIRERKFLTMGTAELKRDLKARLGLDQPGQEVD